MEEKRSVHYILSRAVQIGILTSQLERLFNKALVRREGAETSSLAPQYIKENEDAHLTDLPSELWRSEACKE